jgi:hypothetical protein
LDSTRGVESNHPGDPAEANHETPPSAAETEEVLAVARSYKSYGRVDDEMRWAPYLCRQPDPGVARPSASDDDSTHGQKLYSVFVKDHSHYPADVSEGQVVVKESFMAVPAPDVVYAPRSEWTPPESDHFYPYAQKDGVTFRTGDFAGLFIVMKLAANTPNTDEGWRYAIVSPDLQVAAAGRLNTCVGCHQYAPHDRLFGVPTSIETR